MPVRRGPETYSQCGGSRGLYLWDLANVEAREARN